MPVGMNVSVEVVTEFNTVQKDDPGEVDPDQKKHDGTERAVKCGVGFVESDVVDKEHFRNIPDQ